MSTVGNSSDQETGVIRGGLLALYYLTRRSIALSIAAFGIILMIFGSVVVEPYHPIFAAMFGIWGTTAVILGLLAYSILWLNKAYGRMKES